VKRSRGTRLGASLGQRGDRLLYVWARECPRPHKEKENLRRSRGEGAKKERTFETKATCRRRGEGGRARKHLLLSKDRKTRRSERNHSLVASHAASNLTKKGYRKLGDGRKGLRLRGELTRAEGKNGALRSSLRRDGKRENRNELKSTLAAGEKELEIRGPKHKKLNIRTHPKVSRRGEAG